MSDDFMKALKEQPETHGKLAILWGNICYDWWPSVRPHWVRILSWWFHDQVTCRIWPRQRWLTKVIPKTWNDKDILIENLLYACVSHYVSPKGENAFDQIEIPKEDKAMLTEIYLWASGGRAAAFAAIQATYPPVNLDNESLITWLSREDPVRDACYMEVRRLEAALEERDTRYLTWIVNRRKTLWT